MAAAGESNVQPTHSVQESQEPSIKKQLQESSMRKPRQLGRPRFSVLCATCPTPCNPEEELEEWNFSIEDGVEISGSNRNIRERALRYGSVSSTRSAVRGRVTVFPRRSLQIPPSLPL